MLRFLFRKAKQFSRFILTLVTFPVAFFLYLFGFRIFGLIHVQAIGHLALEPDVYIKRVKLGLEKKYKMILLAPTSRISDEKTYPEKVVCNEALLNYWRSYFYVITSPYITTFLQRKTWNFLHYPIPHYVMQYKKKSVIYETYRAYSGNPLISLSEEHEKKGEQVLQKWGLNEKTWFICFHARDHDYNSLEKDIHFSRRNSDVNSLYNAVEEISRAGGYAIRLGDKKSKPLDNKFHKLNVIDYTKTDYKSPDMDLFLMKKCAFFVGGSTGLTHLSTVLGTPCVLVNCVPLCHLPFTSADLMLPKLYHSKKLNRFMTFKEITHSPCAHYMHNSEFEDDQIEVISNTEEEIKQVVLEMMARKEKRAHYTEAQLALREKFSAIFPPDVFCHGFSSDIGIDFLEKYSHLL